MCGLDFFILQRPGLFAEEPQLKIRAAGEALQTAGELLQEESLVEGGQLTQRCGEDLGRGDKASLGQRYGAGREADKIEKRYLVERFVL